jgi:hypothetical protein
MSMCSQQKRSMKITLSEVRCIEEQEHCIISKFFYWINYNQFAEISPILIVPHGVYVLDFTFQAMYKV